MITVKSMVNAICENCELEIEIPVHIILNGGEINCPKCGEKILNCNKLKT